MSYFPHAARCFVVLALACGAIALPTVAVAAEQPGSASGQHQRHETRAEKRARIRAAAIEAERIRVARAHALAVQQLKARLRADKHVRKRAVIVFDKNWHNPYDSRVLFRVWARTGPKGAKKWLRVENRAWRAGSGLDGPVGKDECHRGAGWAPNGTYSFVQHNRRKGQLINGRVFELESKACRNGTLRQLMFIHSEQNWDNTQCRNTKGDDGCRWEVPRVNDYRSWGCIKMAPDDVKMLTRRFHRYFKAEVRYPTSVVKVRVKN
jgi:hypothetical protein